MRLEEVQIKIHTILWFSLGQYSWFVSEKNRKSSRVPSSPSCYQYSQHNLQTNMYNMDIQIAPHVHLVICCINYPICIWDLNKYYPWPQFQVICKHRWDYFQFSQYVVNVWHTWCWPASRESVAMGSFVSLPPNKGTKSACSGGIWGYLALE